MRVGTIVVAAVLIAPATAPAQDGKSQEELIRAAVVAWHAAEDAHDGEAAAALMTEDYFHVTSFGQVLDRSGLLRGLEMTRAMGIPRSSTPGEITVVDHAAAAVARYPFEYRDYGSPLEGSYWNTVVLVQREGSWKIANSHSSRVDPLGMVEVVELGSWPVAPLTEAEQARYVGSYDTGTEVVEVWRDEGQLRITPGENPGMDPLFLAPMGDHSFVQGLFRDGEWKRIYWPDIRIRFVVENGAVRAYELARGERVLERGERLEGATGAAPAVPGDLR